MPVWPVKYILLMQICFFSFIPVPRPYNYSNTFNLKQYNSKEIHIFNIFVVFDISMLNMTFVQ